MTDPTPPKKLIFIPLPTTIPTGYGVNSTRGPHGILFGGRGLASEREHVRKAAERIGVSYGEFVRRTIVDAATYVLENIPEQD